MREFIDIVEADTRAQNAVLTVFRGETSSNRNGNFWTENRAFARQFTQSGLDSEVLVRYIWRSDLYTKSVTVYAGDEAGVDAALEAARGEEYKAILLNEGPQEPDSIFVFDRSCLKRYPPR